MKHVDGIITKDTTLIGRKFTIKEFSNFKALENEEQYINVNCCLRVEFFKKLGDLNAK